MAKGSGGGGRNGGKRSFDFGSRASAIINGDKYSGRWGNEVSGGRRYYFVRRGRGQEYDIASVVGGRLSVHSQDAFRYVSNQTLAERLIG
jgi:hypothetical protein